MISKLSPRIFLITLSRVCLISAIGCCLVFLLCYLIHFADINECLLKGFFLSITEG